jgi:dihydroorotate dehydrogenase
LDSYTAIARPLLFALDAERAHNWGLGLLKFASRVIAQPMPLKTSLGELANPVGMAAGYDKTGRHLDDLAKLGFGYLVAGTFTLSPWPGNPKPRVARNVKENTLVNALGFPNPGIDEFIRNLRRQHTSSPPPPSPGTGKKSPLLVASVSGKTVEEIRECYARVQPHIAGIEINLSSPNTPKLKDMREPPAFSELAEELAKAKTRPTYLKIPPYLNDEQFGGVLKLVKRWEALGFEGVTASNSLPVEDARMAVKRGGLSGPPLLEHTMAAVRLIRRTVAASSSSFEVNAVGGISSPEDAAALLRSGATTVQVFTAMVYQGPALIRKMLLDPQIRALMKARRSDARKEMGLSL